MHLQRYSHDVRLEQRNAKGGKRWWWPGADSTEVKAVGCHEVAFGGTLQSCDCHTYVGSSFDGLHIHALRTS